MTRMTPLRQLIDHKGQVTFYVLNEIASNEESRKVYHEAYDALVREYLISVQQPVQSAKDVIFSDYTSACDFAKRLSETWADMLYTRFFREKEEGKTFNRSDVKTIDLEVNEGHKIFSFGCGHFTCSVLVSPINKVILAAKYMHSYNCTDGHHWENTTAATAEEAAQTYVDAGAWLERDRTQWITVYVKRADADKEERPERVKITLPATEPECTEMAHDWRNEKTVANGGGVIVQSRCNFCGLRREEDTWASDPSDGEQGLYQVRYYGRDNDD